MSKVKYLSNSSRNLPHTVIITPVTLDRWNERTEGTERTPSAYVEEGVFSVSTVSGEIKVADFLIILDGDDAIDLNDDITVNSHKCKVMSIEKVRGMKNEITETEVFVGRRVIR